MPLSEFGRSCEVCGGQKPPYDFKRSLPFCGQEDHWPEDDVAHHFAITVGRVDNGPEASTMKDGR